MQVYWQGTVPFLKFIIFLLVITGLAYVSRASLRAPRSHGFYRFFAWAVILVLFLRNVDAWFRTPLAWHQVVSWLLLCASLVPLVLGVRLLRRAGRSVSRGEDAALLGMEKTAVLITSGVYGYVRHPMYSSLLLLTWGIFFKQTGWIGALLVLTATVLLTATARAEEQENIRFFGQAYSDYMQRTRMFIPFLF